MRISDWSSDVCSSDLLQAHHIHAWDNDIVSVGFQEPLQPALDLIGVADLALESESFDSQLDLEYRDHRTPGILRRDLNHPCEQLRLREIRRESCRERVCQYVSYLVATVLLHKTSQTNIT